MVLDRGGVDDAADASYRMGRNRGRETGGALDAGGACRVAIQPIFLVAHYIYRWGILRSRKSQKLAAGVLYPTMAWKDQL